MSETWQFRELIQALFSRQDQRPMRSWIAKGAAGTFAMKVSSSVLSFLTGLLLARLLGVSGYGTYAYALAWISLAAIPVMMGLDKLFIRNIASFRTQSAWGELHGMLRWATKTVLCSSLACIFITALIVVIMTAGRDTDHLRLTFLVGLPLLGLGALTRLRQTTLQGLNQVITGQMPEMLAQPAIFIALLSLTYIIREDTITSAFAIGMNVLAAAASFIIGGWLMFRAIPKEVAEAEPVFHTKQWFKSALPLMLIAALQAINLQADVVMLGAIKGTAPVGIYTVANRLAGLISFILFAVNAPLGPAIASMYASNEKERLQQLITKSSRTVLLISLPVAFVMIVFGHWLLLLFGRDFTQGQTALAVLSIGHIVNALTGSVGLILMMTGHERDASLGIGLSVLLNILLNAMFIPRWGVTGAAVATTSSMIFWNIILSQWVTRRLGIHASAFGKIPFFNNKDSRPYGDE